ncbi:MAG: hypothetical protein QW353_08360 [Candidatus Korarchaeum sp.]
MARKIAYDVRLIREGKDEIVTETVYYGKDLSLCMSGRTAKITLYYDLKLPINISFSRGSLLFKLFKMPSVEKEISVEDSPDRICASNGSCGNCLFLKKNVEYHIEIYKREGEDTVILEYKTREG